jgi:O-antigen ligase
MLVQIAVVPGASSPFRAPKAVLALTFILVVVGISIAGQFSRGRIGLRWSPIATVLVSLPLLQLASVLWSSSPRLALTAALTSSVWIIGALWIATTTSDERRRLIHAAAIGAAVSGIVLMLQATGRAVVPLGGPGPGGRLSLTGLTGNPADLAMASVLLLPLLLAAPGTSTRPWIRWSLAALLTLATVVSQTLTGFVALGLVWLTWLVRHRSRRLWIAAVALAVVFVGIGMATGLDNRISSQIRRLQSGDWYFLLSARGDGWTAASEMIRGRPVTGVGASNFTHAYYPSRVEWVERTGTIGHRAELATHFDLAHCDPLQMSAELGFPGLVWMIAFAIVVARHRPRGDPLPLLAAAAFAPFALLHFPTHLAVGLVPLVLVLAHLLADADETAIEPQGWFKRLGWLLAVGLMVVGVYWQFQTMMLNLWRGGLSHALTTAQSLDESQRAQRAAMVEAQIVPRLGALEGAQPWLWRMVGQARMARGEHIGAETAFRTAMSLWPHEEAEFGLGLALAAQGRQLESTGQSLDTRNRRGEAIMHLVRVCRTNPALVRLIDDWDLRKAVAEIVYRGEPPKPRKGRVN